jgi:hypothetical protein
MSESFAAATRWRMTTREGKRLSAMTVARRTAASGEESSAHEPMFFGYFSSGCDSSAWPMALRHAPKVALS